MDNSVVLAQLQRKENLVFLQYKPLSSYSFSKELPISLASIVNLAPVLTPQEEDEGVPIQLGKVRSDSAELWHARTGHLGPDALRALVWSARGVSIKGPTRVKCEVCAMAHAGKEISRAKSENFSPRPFWDLFDYPKNAQDGSNWLLLFKDEFSGKLFGYALKSKDQDSIFEKIRNFGHTSFT